jgi:hypothetical protein
MSRLRFLAAGLFLLTWFVAASPSTGSEQRADTWRQTRQGWQHSEDFIGPPVEYRRPSLHPAVVGSLEVLLTMLAMLALPNDGRATARDARRTSEA